MARAVFGVSPDNPATEIDVQEIHRTESAILVLDAEDRKAWLPLSQVIILEEDLIPGGVTKLLIPVWLAMEKRLI